MGRGKIGAQHSDSFVNCHICGTENNVDKQVYIIATDNNHGAEYAGKSCDSCKTLITVVISTFGATSIENELIKKQNINGNTKKK